MEAGRAIEEAALAEVEQEEFDDGSARQAVEELLLMEAATIEVALEKGGAQAEWGSTGGDVAFSVGEDLPSLQGGVVVVATDPVADPFAEGKVVEIAGDLADRPVGDRDGIDEALVAYACGPEEPHVEG